MKLTVEIERGSKIYHTSLQISDQAYPEILSSAVSETVNKILVQAGLPPLDTL